MLLPCAAQCCQTTSPSPFHHLLLPSARIYHFLPFPVQLQLILQSSALFAGAQEKVGRNHAVCTYRPFPPTLIWFWRYFSMATGRILTYSSLLSLPSWKSEWRWYGEGKSDRARCLNCSERCFLFLFFFRGREGRVGFCRQELMHLQHIPLLDLLIQAHQPPGAYLKIPSPPMRKHMLDSRINNLFSSTSQTASAPSLQRILPSSWGSTISIISKSI